MVTPRTRHTLACHSVLHQFLSFTGIYMERKYSMKWIFLSLILLVVMAFIEVVLKDLQPRRSHYHPAPVFSLTSMQQNIIPVNNTKHFIISAYKDHRINGAIRIISIINRDKLNRLFCIISCAQEDRHVTEAQVDMHSDHFGFPYVTTDLLCEVDQSCRPTTVTISDSSSSSKIPNSHFLPIQNQNKMEQNFQYNFTTCISNLFGGYNNVLQFVQTIEVYKILGIQKVYIYNTSCGPDLEKVLHYYEEEGTLQIEPWPIDKFLNPSRGWNFNEHKGDLHYFGQLTTLNDCIYRNMYKSKYVLLNDIDEIIVPYQHATLGLLMEDLQRQHPSVNVFVFENHIFPKTVFDSSGTFSFARWKKVPGINILEHVYREPDRKNVFNPTKLLVNPREIIQTSVHSVLKNYGATLRVSPDVARLVHVREPLQGSLSKEQLILDTKLWNYKELPKNIDCVLKNSGVYDGDSDFHCKLFSRQ
ncbi:glycosyltransferase family 92 protein F13G3.3-like isoform X2 [Scleropages formosus]|uniref:Glycosyltransferase family 92 protein n=1 Tax=Scleropages formosus TaxID=113540 RepID=A0A8C9S1F2_SCLFO|nr:glycosyltransferase family 92 protein F13G3.3-like isoform X2 [Scleropages formosus]